MYVDTYNHLTLTYADELMDREGSRASALLVNRPDDVSEDEMMAFLEGLPRRYTQLFSRDSVYRHVRVSRDLPPDTIRPWLDRVDTGWELTVLHA